MVWPLAMLVVGLGVQLWPRFLAERSEQSALWQALRERSLFFARAGWLFALVGALWLLQHFLV